MKYKIKLLRDVCIGAASCVAMAPQTFALDQGGKVIELPTSKDDTDDIILQAAQSCPVDAIIVEDEKGNRLWPKK